MTIDYRAVADIRSAAFLRNPDAIAIVSRPGLILDVNEQAEMLTGLARLDLIGQPLTILVPSDHRDRHDQLMAAFFVNPGRRVMGADRDVAIVQHTEAGDRVVQVRIHLAASPIPSLGLVAVATIHQLDHHWSAPTP